MIDKAIIMINLPHHGILSKPNTKSNQNIHSLWNIFDMDKQNMCFELRGGDDSSTPPMLIKMVSV